MNKKGQDSTGAASIIFVITAILVLYILLIPSDARDSLLDDNLISNGNDNGKEEDREYVLDEHVGRLDYLASSEKTYPINSFIMQTKTEANILVSRSGLSVIKSVFEDEKARVDFQANPELTGDLTLAFNIERSGGILSITLNNNLIFRGELSSGNSPHILIENRHLQRHNELVFEVSSPGFVFWRVNRYDLTNINVVGDVTDDSMSKSSQSINIRSADYDLFDTARLRFLPVCDDSVSGLSISINNREVFRGSPDCNVFNHIEFSKDIVYPGVNFLDFKISRGHILMDRVEIISSLDAPEPPVYYFEIDEEEYFSNGELNKYVIAGIEFTNPDRKRLELFVNGRIIGITTTDVKVERDISEFVEPGMNSIEIRPRQDLDISSLKVWLE